MKIDNLLTDEAVLSELGRRIAQFRINENITQKMLAEKAGVGLRTVERLEKGEPGQLLTLIRVLRVLGLLSELGNLVPEPETRPMVLLQKKKNSKRQRASKKASPKESCEHKKTWRWGDET